MAMGITQALKLEQGPIDALAKLPQQQLISMVQQGRLGADILPIILNEKADMAQRAANMQAAAQGQQPSVTERNMMINAQADAQQQSQAPQMQFAQPPMQPQVPMGGIANLPVPEEMYGGGGDEGEGYAGGGIVAFDDGGHVPRYAGDTDGSWVSDPIGFNLLADEANPPRAGGLGFTDYVRQFQDLMAPYRQPSAEETALQKYLKDYGPRSEEETRQSAWLRALEAGLGTMAGESPYAFVNIGKGAQTAAKGFAEDVKERRKQQLAYMQMQADLARKQREEQMADVTGGLGMFKEAKAEERATAERQSREEIARLDRENRMAIAQIPDKAMQVAEQLRKKDPNLSYLDSISQASQALTPRDTYNATRNAVSSAAKDANALFVQTLTVDSKLMEDVRKANAGDKAAAERVKAVKDRIQAEVFRSYQVEGVDLSSGRMGVAGGNEPRVVDFSQLPSIKR